jgi:hypothetical protein
VTVRIHVTLTHHRFCQPRLPSHAPALLSVSTSPTRTTVTVSIHFTHTHHRYCQYPLHSHAPPLLSVSTSPTRTTVTVSIHFTHTHHRYCQYPLHPYTPPSLTHTQTKFHNTRSRITITFEQLTSPLTTTSQLPV